MANIRIRPPLVEGMRIYKRHLGWGWGQLIEGGTNFIDDSGKPCSYLRCEDDYLLPGEPGCPEDPKARIFDEWQVGDEYYVLAKYQVHEWNRWTLVEKNEYSGSMLGTASNSARGKVIAAISTMRLYVPNTNNVAAVSQDDLCSKCGSVGEMVLMSCKCPKCGNIIWGI